MTKKELNELKKQFKIDTCGITRLRGCYVNGEKEKVTCFTENFLNLPEEEQYKYLEIFRKALSGTMGKSLLEMEFAIDNEEKKSLLALRDSELKNDDIADAFYDKVIASCTYPGHYIILLVDQSYDVPQMGVDGETIEDSSDEVYHYVLCAVCPVELSKPGIGYNADLNVFQNQDRSYMISLPMLGFLYPSMTERSEDRDRVLFYTKDTKELNQDFIEKMFQCTVPLTATNQLEVFGSALSEACEFSCDYEVVKNLTQKVEEILEDPNESTTDALTPRGLSNLLESSGLKQEAVEAFTEKITQQMEEQQVADRDKEIKLENLMPQKKVEYRTSEISFKVSPAQMEHIRVEMIDDRKCLVIEMLDGLTINGISIGE